MWKSAPCLCAFLYVPTGISEMCACIVPSARTNMMLRPPAPRAAQCCSPKPARSGTKFVSHMCRPGRTGMKSPSPAKCRSSPSRSPKSQSLPKTNSLLWNSFSTIGRFVVAANLAGSAPLALKCRYRAFSGRANRLFGPHSKLCVRLPSALSTVVEPCPDSTYTTSSYRWRCGSVDPPGGISATITLMKSPRPFRVTKAARAPSRSHGAVSAARRSTPKSSITGTFCSPSHSRYGAVSSRTSSAIRASLSCRSCGAGSCGAGIGTPGGAVRIPARRARAVRACARGRCRRVGGPAGEGRHGKLNNAALLHEHRWSALHADAAVGVEEDAGHAAGGVRGQEHVAARVIGGGQGDLQGVARAEVGFAARGPAEAPLAHAERAEAAQVGVQRPARRDGVDPDLRRQLVRQRDHRAPHGELGRQVQDAPAARVEGGGRRGEDDAAAGARQGGNGGFHRGELTPDVDGERLAERVVEHLIRYGAYPRVVVEQPHAVDQDVQAAQCPHRMVHGPLRAGQRGGVPLHHHAARQVRFQGGALARVEFEGGGAGALAQVRPEHGAPDAGARPDDQRPLALQRAHLSSSCPFPPAPPARPGHRCASRAGEWYPSRTAGRAAGRAGPRLLPGRTAWRESR